MYNLSDCRYRRKIGSANPPLIPYLGIHLTDFTYIYECLKKDKDKAERKAQYKERFDQFNQMLDEIAQMQSSCFYSFPLDFKFTDSLEQEYSVNEDDQKAATESQYELSYKWEPRGEAMQKSDDWRQTILSPKNLFAVPDGIMKNLAGMNPMPSHSRGESETAKSTTPVAKKKSRNNENPSSMGDSVIEAIPENPIILIDEEEPLEWADRPASVRKRLLNLIGMGSGKKKSRPVSVGDDAFVNEDLLRSYTQESHSSSRKYSNLEGKRELEIRTTATAMPPSIATPKPPSELRGKLHIQAILYKKEEFDEEGNRSTDRHWAPFKIVLDGTKLTITPHDSEPPQKQSSLPLSFVTGGEKDSPSLVKQKSIKPPISPYTSGSLKETKSQSRLPLQNLFKNLEIGSSSSSSTSIPTNSNTLSPIEKSTAIILPVPVPAKALYEKAETRARTFSFPNPIVKSDSIEINPSQFLHQEEPKSDLRRKPDLKPNRKTPAPLMSIESGVSVFNAPVEHQDSSSGLLSSQPKPQQETRHRTTSFPTPMAKQDSIPEAIPYMLQEEPKSSIQRKPVLKPNRKVSTAAVVDSGPRKSIIPPTLSAQPSGGDFKILQSSLFTRSISSDFFKVSQIITYSLSTRTLKSFNLIILHGLIE